MGGTCTLLIEQQEKIHEDGREALFPKSSRQIIVENTDSSQPGVCAVKYIVNCVSSREV